MYVDDILAMRMDTAVILKSMEPVVEFNDDEYYEYVLTHVDDILAISEDEVSIKSSF